MREDSSVLAAVSDESSAAAARGAGCFISLGAGGTSLGASRLGRADALTSGASEASIGRIAMVGCAGDATFCWPAVRCESATPWATAPPCEAAAPCKTAAPCGAERRYETEGLAARSRAIVASDTS